MLSVLSLFMIAIRTDYGIKMLKFSHNIILRKNAEFFVFIFLFATILGRGYIDVCFYDEFNESGKYLSDSHIFFDE